MWRTDFSWRSKNKEFKIIKKKCWVLERLCIIIVTEKKNKPNRTKATIKVTIKRMESKTWGHEIKSSSHSGEY